MSTDATRISDQELLSLAEFLESDRVSPEALDVSQLDGFLTALAVAPRPVPESDWWSEIWGPRPAFADAAERDRLESIVRTRHAEVKQQIREDPEAWAPIFFETDEGEVDPSAWAGGFVLGMELRREAWMPLFEEEEGFMLVLPILLAASEGEFARELEIDPEEVDTIMEQAPELVPGCVVGIDAFFRERADGGAEVNGYERD